VEAIERGVEGPQATGAMRSVLGGGEIGGRRIDVVPAGTGTVGREELQRTMTARAGVVRSAESLAAAADACASVAPGDGPAAWELANLATVGRVLCTAALVREESRGAHTRTDFPDPSAALRTRLVASSA
jgi:aspartate oxidase